ncbi:MULTISPECIES: 1-phosphofructokinase family hexose kinase [Roseobacteraceae]|uniref:1-phosphofructokinase family hexose kinase n=1 Tax=Roseobacteraceae TaxID=2854170 RepID=UPI00080AA186|nr:MULTISPECIES: 1-phosphofructokinase family hexose kinase [Roseobacteraceae]ANT60343.1 sugar kinase [Salipiger sp. CCB-MM3]MCA0997542.1 1-phosphofructokinase family hexose kinase [Alloyangia pacifica]NDV99000.1 1-phosphofructokinase family hexose kinase [Salipiger sp. PrR002]NDW55953.1 1-phosphofructokinase family hexose kinase [Salipiger sp. PrR004]
MRDILTVTLNPALDLSTTADRVEAGPKLRCDAPAIDPGGGGINVARLAAELGGPARAFVALSGPTGMRLEAALAELGLPMVRMKAPGETRESFAVHDRQTGAQYRFVMPGPVWSAGDVMDALDAISSTVPQGGIVVLSGSQPPGVPDDFPTELCRALKGRGAYVIVDTSGPVLEALARGTDPAPAVLRMDSLEAEELAGRPLMTRADSAGFAAELVARGAAERVILARGADGSVMAGPDGLWQVSAAKVSVLSAVGAGDSFVGAYAFGISSGLSAPEALALGAAAASATVTTPGTSLSTRAMIHDLLDQCGASAL